MVIITDTPALFTPISENNDDFVVISAYTVIGSASYRDFHDMDTAKLLQKVKEGEVPKTSQPSIGEIVDVYEAIDDDILVMPIGDGLSGTYSNMEAARNLVDGKDRIHVLNTKTLAGAQHHLVETALALRSVGMDIHAIKEKLETQIESSLSFFIPTDFNFLKRSGRLTPIAAKIGTVMKIVPVMTQTEDKRRICALGIKRTKKKALDAIMEQLEKAGVDETYVISVSCDVLGEEAQTAREMLEQRFSNTKVELYTLVPSLVCHSGPSCILIQAIKR